ncbi:hypothetical protein, partial [Xanthomonas translucens]|uniref:hypothetical protein n=1 Tax=Xanthomonas campestris pv. translucens TaxID=343 RepID=UPI0021B7C8A3
CRLLPLAAACCRICRGRSGSAPYGGGHAGRVQAGPAEIEPVGAAQLILRESLSGILKSAQV